MTLIYHYYTAATTEKLISSEEYDTNALENLKPVLDSHPYQCQTSTFNSLPDDILTQFQSEFAAWDIIITALKQFMSSV